MGPQYLLGIDIGTQGTKAVLFDDRGRAVATALRKSRLLHPAPGAVEEDPERQFKTVCQCIKACVVESGVDPRRVAGIAIDGQMAGVIGIDADGRHVTPYDSWLDTRCQPYIDAIEREAGEEIIRKTGGPASFNHGPKILWWKRERPEQYARIARFVQPAAYAAMRLCGLHAAAAFIDKTYLHFSGFADSVRKQWDADLCRTFGVAQSKLPRIVEPEEMIGGLTAAAARACGLKPCTPVAAGCGDTAASFLACGATRAGVCIDVAGTASVFAATTADFTPDTRFGVLGWGHSATPGLWHPYAYINGGGMNVEWFVAQLAARPNGDAAVALADLNRLAARLRPQSDDPMFLPHLGGRVSPSQPKLRGCWAGLTWSHTSAHLYRALLEGVALEYCIYRDVLKTLNPKLRIAEVRVTGGGQRSAPWNRIKADALGVPIVRIERDEGAPLGAALVAGRAVGMFPSLAHVANDWIKTGAAVEPCREMAGHYARRLAKYRRLLELAEQWGED